MNKRGISPLLATVLIIGFTIILAVLVIAWLSGVFEGKLGTEECVIKGQELCASANSLIELDTAFIDNTAPTDDEYKTTISYLGSGTTPTVKVECINEDGSIIDVPTVIWDASGNVGVATYDDPTHTAGFIAQSKIYVTYSGDDIDVPGVTCSDVACTPLTANF